MTPHPNAKQIESTVNVLWELYDEAQSAGDKAQAAELAGKVFQLLAQLPENAVTLKLDAQGKLVAH